MDFQIDYEPGQVETPATATPAARTTPAPGSTPAPCAETNVGATKPPLGIKEYKAETAGLEDQVGWKIIRQWANQPHCAFPAHQFDALRALNWHPIDIQHLAEAYDDPEVSTPADGSNTVHANKSKVPEPDRFGGSNATPRSVKGWLRQVDLAIKHLQPEDPVLYALPFLKDHAAR